MSNDVTQPEEKLHSSFYEIWYSADYVNNPDEEVLSLYYSKNGIEFSRYIPPAVCTVTTIRSYEQPQLMFSGTYEEAVTWLKENGYKLVEGRVVTKEELDAKAQS